MESSETGPKVFESSVELLPLTTPGISSLEEFKEREQDLQNLERLKSYGLTDDEIKLYRDEKDGIERTKIENNILHEKLQYIYSKLEAAKEKEKCQENSESDATPSTSKSLECSFSDYERQPTYYPEKHPMNSIKELEKDLFDHIKVDKMAPLTKRRKLMRRLQRKQDALVYDTAKVGVREIDDGEPNRNPNSLWDVKEIPKRVTAPPERLSALQDTTERNEENQQKLIGPKPQAHYTIKDNRIVRLEPAGNNNAEENDEYHAVDIVVPVNEAEERLLEGTKLSIDQIRSMERFKHYQPGRPSKVLFLKNISPAASHEDISILFNQFVHENEGPVHVRLMTGRLRGQAFVHFQCENVAIKALEDVNGTVVKGRPVIVQFGKNSNNIQHDFR